MTFGFSKESEFSKLKNDIREKEFKEKLYALLKEYKVEIELDETSCGYGGSTYDIQFSLEGYTDVEADDYVSYRFIKLGNYIS